jgi:hypothetical protein
MAKRYSGYSNMLGLAFTNPMGFFEGMMNTMAQHKQERLNSDAGIEYNEELFVYGVPTKNIEFKFDMLDFNGKYYVGRADELNHVFDADGNLLFSAISFEYLKQDMFFVVNTEKDEKSSQAYGALYRNGEKLTDDVFRSKDMSDFAKGKNFCIFGYKEFGKECVVNKEGEIVYEMKSSFDYAYLYNNILCAEGKYINLFSGETICKKGYRTDLTAGNLRFVEVDEQVFKIDTVSGEFEVFGEPKTAPQTNVVKKVDDSATSTKEVVPKPPKQTRNEKCACGSGLKYKNCCMK